MPMIVPLASVASQTFTASMGGQAVACALYQLGVGAAARMFLDVTANSQAILNARQCRAYGGLPDTRARFMMVGRRYLGFLGDLLFLDTQATAASPTQDPQPSGLGTRWLLLYFTEAELQAAGLIS